MRVNRSSSVRLASILEMTRRDVISRLMIDSRRRLREVGAVAKRESP